MYRIRGALFSLRDVLAREGNTEIAQLRDAIRLFRFLIAKGVKPVLISNSKWVLGKRREPFEEYLSREVGTQLRLYLRDRDIGPKQTSEATATILGDEGWNPHEVVYVGCSDEDMQAASNGGLLFLNAQWYAKKSPYGFDFQSAADIARFIECCCLMPGDWFWGFDRNGHRCYAIAPLAEYSRRYPDAAEYSADAKQAVKFDRGDLRFWSLLMVARLHQSGLAAAANYVTTYPGHRSNSPAKRLNNALKMLPARTAQGYLSDLILRHTTAPKSQELRRRNETATVENQLSTIRLRSDPLRTGPQQRRFVRPPLRRAKTVLVVDDICTQGNSFEAARQFISASGATVISVSWLKTPGNDYSEVQALTPALRKPYAAYRPTSVRSASHRMSGDIINANAPDEITAAFRRYHNWDWPEDL